MMKYFSNDIYSTSTYIACGLPRVVPALTIRFSTLTKKASEKKIKKIVNGLEGGDSIKTLFFKKKLVKKKDCL